DPVGPALTSNRSSTCPSFSPSDCASSNVFASFCARRSSTLRTSATRAGVASSAAREEVVARIAARDVHDLAAEADLVDVLAEDDFHLTAVGDVREQRHLTRALDRNRDLPLMPAARAGDAPRTDLSLLRDVAAQLVRVLVVDLLDLLLAEVAPALADRAGRARTLAPRLPVAVPLLSSSALRHQKGMSSSAEPLKSS